MNLFAQIIQKLIFSQINARAILQDHKMWPLCDMYGMLHVPHQSLGPTMSLKDWLGNYDDDIDEIGFKDENWPHWMSLIHVVEVQPYRWRQ